MNSVNENGSKSRFRRTFLRLVLNACALFGFVIAQPAFAQNSNPSLAQMAGQMVVVGFTGNDVGDAGVRAAISDIAAERIGGVMFLGVNVASQRDVIEMTRAFQAAAPNLPTLITVDQEGGLVERLTQKVGFIEVAKPQQIAQGSATQAGQIYARMANDLMEWGFNTNFGPVADLNINKNNPIIARFGRSFGEDAMQVVEFSNAFVKAHRGSGVLTALKHFPGHGSSASDSHEGFVDITNSWGRAELRPYELLADAGMIDMVMVGHLFANVRGGGDSAIYPATLSRDWVTSVLRNEVGFNGVVITDDMEMGAIRQHYGFKQSIILAVNAGVDILLFSNTANNRSSIGKEIVDVLLAEAARDPEFRARIAQSYQRIVRMKAGL